MGCGTSSIPHFDATIALKTKEKFTISYHLFAEHILLLRKVIKHPEMTTAGPKLDAAIFDYCQRMAHNGMRTPEQQQKLPWQIEWIWHVHRLHPINYRDDCEQQLSDGLVDKTDSKIFSNFNQKYKPKTTLSSARDEHVFAPSIDLASAAIRQTDFLEKFKNHSLYSAKLGNSQRTNFKNLIQNYIWFLKLADTKTLIVPTFEIDIIWHTHMRCPSRYHNDSKASCGFIFDHDDSIESCILNDAFKLTADRWEKTYKTTYGQNIDPKTPTTMANATICAVVSVPAYVPTYSSGCGGAVGGCGGAGGGGGGGCGGCGCGGGGCGGCG